MRGATPAPPSHALPRLRLFADIEHGARSPSSPDDADSDEDEAASAGRPADRRRPKRGDGIITTDSTQAGSDLLRGAVLGRAEETPRLQAALPGTTLPRSSADRRGPGSVEEPELLKPARVLSWLHSRYAGLFAATGGGPPADRGPSIASACSSGIGGVGFGGGGGRGRQFRLAAEVPPSEPSASAAADGAVAVAAAVAGGCLCCCGWGGPPDAHGEEWKSAGSRSQEGRFWVDTEMLRLLLVMVACLWDVAMDVAVIQILWAAGSTAPASLAVALVCLPLPVSAVALAAAAWRAKRPRLAAPSWVPTRGCCEAQGKQVAATAAATAASAPSCSLGALLTWPRLVLTLLLLPMLVVVLLLAVVALDLAALAGILLLQATARRHDLAQGTRSRMATWEVRLRQHWACRVPVRAALESLPMAVLQVILLAAQLPPGSSSEQRALLAASLASSVVACLAAAAELHASADQAGLPSTRRYRLLRAAAACLRYEGCGGAPPEWVERVSPARRQVQLDIGDPGFGKLHRLQKVCLISAAMSGRPTVIVANSTAAAAAASAAAKPGPLAELEAESAAAAATTSTSAADGSVSGAGKPAPKAPRAPPPPKPVQALLLLASRDALRPFVEALPVALPPSASSSLSCQQHRQRRQQQQQLPPATAAWLPGTSPSGPPALLPPPLLQYPWHGDPPELQLSLVSFEPGVSSSQVPWRRLRRLLAVTMPLACLTVVVIRDTHMHTECIQVRQWWQFFSPPSHLRTECIQELCVGLLRPGCALRTLVLSEAGMLSTSFSMLCNTLATNRSVTSLDLSSSKLGPGGPEALKSMLVRNDTLRELILAYTGLSSAGAAEVMFGASCSSSLQRLDLSQNHAGDDVPLLHLLEDGRHNRLRQQQLRQRALAAATAAEAVAAGGLPRGGNGGGYENCNNSDNNGDGSGGGNQHKDGSSKQQQRQLGLGGGGGWGGGSVGGPPPPRPARAASMRHLDLSFNWIQDNAAGWLLLALEFFPSLTRLHLNHNNYCGPPGSPMPLSRQASGGATSWQYGSGNLHMRVLDVSEQANRDVGLTFLAHLLLHRRISSADGGVCSLASRLQGIKLLDVRGLHLPAWFSTAGAPGRPPGLLSDPPRRQIVRSSSVASTASGVAGGAATGTGAGARASRLDSPLGYSRRQSEATGHGGLGGSGAAGGGVAASMAVGGGGARSGGSLWTRSADLLLGFPDDPVPQPPLPPRAADAELPDHHSPGGASTPGAASEASSAQPGGSRSSAGGLGSLGLVAKLLELHQQRLASEAEGSPSTPQHQQLQQAPSSGASPLAARQLQGGALPPPAVLSGVTLHNVAEEDEGDEEPDPGCQSFRLSRLLTSSVTSSHPVSAAAGLDPASADSRAAGEVGGTSGDYLDGLVPLGPAIAKQSQQQQHALPPRPRRSSDAPYVAPFALPLPPAASSDMAAASLNSEPLHPDLCLPQTWTLALSLPGAVLDTSSKAWKKLPKGQQVAALYFFFSQNSHVLVTNVSRPARDAIEEELEACCSLSEAVGKAGGGSGGAASSCSAGDSDRDDDDGIDDGVGDEQAAPHLLGLLPPVTPLDVTCGRTAADMDVAGQTSGSNDTGGRGGGGGSSGIGASGGAVGAGYGNRGRRSSERLASGCTDDAVAAGSSGRLQSLVVNGQPGEGDWRSTVSPHPVPSPHSGGPDIHGTSLSLWNVPASYRPSSLRFSGTSRHSLGASAGANSAHSGSASLGVRSSSGGLIMMANRASTGDRSLGGFEEAEEAEGGDGGGSVAGVLKPPSKDRPARSGSALVAAGGPALVVSDTTKAAAKGPPRVPSTKTAADGQRHDASCMEGGIGVTTGVQEGVRLDQEAAQRARVGRSSVSSSRQSLLSALMGKAVAALGSGLAAADQGAELLAAPGLGAVATAARGGAGKPADVFLPFRLPVPQPSWAGGNVVIGDIEEGEGGGGEGLSEVRSSGRDGVLSIDVEEGGGGGPSPQGVGRGGLAETWPSGSPDGSGFAAAARSAEPSSVLEAAQVGLQFPVEAAQDAGAPTPAPAAPPAAAPAPTPSLLSGVSGDHAHLLARASRSEPLPPPLTSPAPLAAAAGGISPAPPPASLPPRHAGPRPAASSSTSVPTSAATDGGHSHPSGPDGGLSHPSGPSRPGSGGHSHPSVPLRPGLGGERLQGAPLMGGAGVAGVPLLPLDRPPPSSARRIVSAEQSYVGGAAGASRRSYASGASHFSGFPWQPPSSSPPRTISRQGTAASAGVSGSPLPPASSLNLQGLHHRSVSMFGPGSASYRSGSQGTGAAAAAATMELMMASNGALGASIGRTAVLLYRRQVAATALARQRGVAAAGGWPALPLPRRHALLAEAAAERGQGGGGRRHLRRYATGGGEGLALPSSLSAATGTWAAAPVRQQGGPAAAKGDRTNTEFAGYSAPANAVYRPSAAAGSGEGGSLEPEVNPGGGGSAPWGGSVPHMADRPPPVPGLATAAPPPSRSSSSATRAVILIGSAESGPPLRLLPRALELPLLAAIRQATLGEECDGGGTRRDGGCLEAALGAGGGSSCQGDSAGLGRSGEGPQAASPQGPALPTAAEVHGLASSLPPRSSSGHLRGSSVWSATARAQGRDHGPPPAASSPAPPLPLVEVLLRGLNERQVQQVEGLLALARYLQQCHGLEAAIEYC